MVGKYRLLQFLYTTERQSKIFDLKMLTSSNGHPAERKTACDCRTNNFKSLSFISVSIDGFVRSTIILNVTTDVNSPSISLTHTIGLSEIFSNGNGFQFFTIIDPLAVLAISGE